MRFWVWLCRSGPLYLLQTQAHPDLFPKNGPAYEEAVGIVRVSKDLKLDDEPARPTVPTRFSAPINYTSFDTGFLQTGKGFFAQDADEKAMRVETIRHTLGMDLPSNITTLIRGNKSYNMNGGDHAICRQVAFFGQQQFADFFAWAANPLISEYRGKRVVAGRVCSLWYLLSTTQTRISLCAEGNAPVELNVTLPKNNSGGGISFNFSYQFGHLTKGSQVSEDLLQKPEICDTSAPPCENGRGLEPVPLNAYIFHPGMSADDYNLEDQNVADVAGDAAFICFDRLFRESKVDHNYTLISRYALEVSPAFGQYCPCNGYPDTIPRGPSCIAGEPRLVGRGAPFSAGDGELRCAAESPLGFWYGLPKGGRCSPGERPSKEAWATGCTWSVKQRVKTIHQACLLKDHGFLNYCKADVLEHKGFRRSAKALEAAFASEDPSIGGCADVGGPGVDENSMSMVLV